LPKRKTIIVSDVDAVIEHIPLPKDNPVVLQLNGRAETLPVGIGTEVGKGDLLVQLDASNYELELRAAEARLEMAQKQLIELAAGQRPEEVRRARALYDEAVAHNQRAEAEFRRISTLSTAISRSEYDEKQAATLTTRAVMAQAKASLDVAQAGPTDEEIEVAKAVIAAAQAEVDQKRWKVDKTSIVAPYDAVITDRYVSTGDRVTAMPRVEIMEIMEISYLFAEVGVPERFVRNIRPYDDARVIIQGVAEEVPGTIVRINDKVDPATRTFRVRVGIDNSQRQYRVGQFVRVRLNLGTSSRTLAIDRRALVYAGGQPRVFVFADGHVRLRTIQPGVQAENMVEVLSGLEEGESIVVDDPSVITDGMPVRVRASADLANSARGDE
jgi:multidrug efflux pump subunit AcrA (membrane-fusion protein)